jgi:hypothetical protein
VLAAWGRGKCEGGRKGGRVMLQLTGLVLEDALEAQSVGDIQTASSRTDVALSITDGVGILGDVAVGGLFIPLEPRRQTHVDVCLV